jgi:hypothetical protein
MARSRSCLSWISIASLGLKRMPITVCSSPTAAISAYIAAPLSAANLAESSFAPTSAAEAVVAPPRSASVKAVTAAIRLIRHPVGTPHGPSAVAP